MRVISTSTGSYPRIGDAPDLQLLRRTISQWEKGEKSAQELARAEDEMARLSISEQTEAGLELVTDGQVRWYDPLSHVAGKLEGIKINGLLRFFDTNFYFRQPVIIGEVKHRRPIVLDEYRFGRSVSSKPLKPVITGPYTLARLSIVEADCYKTFESLVEAYALAIAEEIRALVEAGADIVQVDEPAILKNKEHNDVFVAGLKLLAGATGKAQLALYTYFGEGAWLYRSLPDLPVDILGIDFTYNRGLVQIIGREGSPKPLGLGLIDGRNTRLEDEKEICMELDMLLPSIKSEFSYLNPSCGLEYLPRDRAFMKLKNLVRIASRYIS